LGDADWWRGERVKPLALFHLGCVVVVHHPPLDDLDVTLRYVNSGKGSRESIREALLRILCYAKTQVPFGQALASLPDPFFKEDFKSLLDKARANTQYGWVDLILPILRILEPFFVSVDIPPLPWHPMPKEVAENGTTSTPSSEVPVVG